MIDYLFLMHNDRSTTGNLEWGPYIEKLQEAGCFNGGSAIGAGECVRRSGPASKLTGHVTGYIRVKAKDLSHAKLLLGGNPVFEAGGQWR